MGKRRGWKNEGAIERAVARRGILRGTVIDLAGVGSTVAAAATTAVAAKPSRELLSPSSLSLFLSHSRSFNTTRGRSVKDRERERESLKPRHCPSSGWATIVWYSPRGLSSMLALHHRAYIRIYRRTYIYKIGMCDISTFGTRYERGTK